LLKMHIYLTPVFEVAHVGKICFDSKHIFPKFMSLFLKASF